MKIHTALKSISDRAMNVILKSKILTTVEENRRNISESLIQGTFSMHDIKPETMK